MAERVTDCATGFSVTVTKRAIKIELPIFNLVRGLEGSPNNCEEVKVKRGKRQEFAAWLAKNLLDDADSETGDNYIATMLESVFERLYEEAVDFLVYPDEDADEDE